MSITNAQLDSDLTAIIADYPQSVTWKGTSYVCAADDLTKGRRGDDAGIFADDTLNIHIRTALFVTTRPRNGEQVTYSGASYRIVSVKTGPDDLMLTLNCEELTA